MLAKYWKIILLVITVIAILFNVTYKLIKKTSFEKEVNSTVNYVKVVDDDNNENKK